MSLRVKSAVELVVTLVYLGHFHSCVYTHEKEETHLNAHNQKYERCC